MSQFVLRTLPFLAVALLMLAPTGMCICSEHEEEQDSEQHEPGCPKVRKLDRPAAPECYAADSLVSDTTSIANDHRFAGPPRPVTAVAHGPPRGRPIYLTLQTLLI